MNKTLFVALLLSVPLAFCATDLAPAQSVPTQPAPVPPSHLGYPAWGLGPFVRSPANPILEPIADAVFHDPIMDQDVYWESLNIVAASVTVYKNQINLVYRAEAKPKAAFHSRQGLAWSDDGIHFQRLPQPVFYAAKDEFQKYEWPGGTEDGRIVQRDDGLFVMLYPAYDGRTARQCVATSPDLRHWTKYGPVFATALGGKYLNLWSKSGSIVSRYGDDGRVVATKINGKYWMYVGDKSFFTATSDDLIHWTPVESPDGKLRNVLPARPGFFDSALTEPGPPPIITPKGILVLYNGENGRNGNPYLLSKAYSGGEALFDLNDPTKLIARSDDYFITPTKWYETQAEFVPVCFIDGMIRYRGKWWLYYDGGDKRVCLATCDAPGFK